MRAGSAVTRLLSELRRRQVFRAAAAYAVAAFVALQAVALAVEPLRLPDWTMTLLWVLALAGFPVAVALAWAFDITTEGVKRVESSAGTVSGEETATAAPGRRTAVYVGLGAFVALTGFVAYAGWQPGGGGPAGFDRSIAVLPFANTSGVEENAYFSDGITEDILTKLARVPGLRVVSRTSIMRYKDSGKSVPEIARELGVRHVLEGSVRRAGDRVRITAQLIDAETDAHLWARDYDRDLTDIFAVQREIAEAIAGALEIELSGGTRARIAAGETADPRAYEFYLRGRELHHRAESRETDEAALRAFREAVAIDPGYARAWAGLARAYGVLTHFPRANPAWGDSAETAARRAIELAPEVAEGYASLGEVLRGQARYPEAMEQQRRALALDPADGIAMAELGQSYHGLGELAEAVRWTRRALAAEPMVGWFHLSLANVLIDLGEFDAAERSLRDAVRVEPGHATTLRGGLADLAVRRGRPTEALAHLDSLGGQPFRWTSVTSPAFLALLAGDAERARRLIGNDGFDFVRNRALDEVLRAHLSGLAGKHQEVEAALDRAERLLASRVERLVAIRGERGDRDAPVLYLTAQIHAQRGERDEAVARLREWIDAGGRDAWLLRNDPLLDPLRGDPRVEEIATRLEGVVREQREQLRREG